MTNNKSKNHTSMLFDLETNSKLDFLSDMTRIPKTQIVKTIIENLFSIGSQFVQFSYNIYPNGDSLTIQFYGKKLLVSGELTDPDEILIAKQVKGR